MEQARPASDLLVRPLTEREIALVEEIRLTGNQFFRKQQYRDAELLYRSGLGLMALGPEGLLTDSAQGSEMRCIKLSPRDVCSRLSLEDNRRAATLFVNLGQCLLNVPGPSREATIAALEAVEACAAAALEQCANAAGAFKEIMRIQCFENRGTVEKELLGRMESILCKFSAGSWLKSFPGPMWDLVSRSTHSHHSARVEMGGLGDMYTRAQRQQAIKHAPVVHRIRGHFSCGSVSNGAVFVVHFSSEQGAPAESYMVTQWRKNAQGEVYMSCWGFFSGDPMKPYLTGVVFKNCLYCLCLLGGVSHMFYCPLGPDGIGLQGTGLKVALEYSEDCSKMSIPLSMDYMGRLVACSDALVACGDAMYLFGGIDILENGQSSAAKDLYRFVPKYGQDGAISHVQCTKVISECSPLPRFGHATFVHGNQIFIYGGVDARNFAHKDMWRFDVETGQWSSVDCFGCKPCARYAAGVASDVERAVLVGGCTNAGLPPSRNNCLWLADVWEFHFAEQCWIQVVPEDRNQPWIAGQQSTACGLVGNDTLLAVGGYGPHRKPENDVLARFTFTSGPALALHAGVAKQGRWRDLAVERACMAAAEGKPDLARMPEKLQELYEAPAGSVTLLSANIADVAGAVYRPSSASGKIVPVLPLKPAFSAKLEMPPRPLNAQSMWGSEECPFDLAPRWLTSPCEISSNLVSASSARHQSIYETFALTARHTVKQFGTVKAAVEFFRLCQPDIPLGSGQSSSQIWRPVQGLADLADSANDTKPTKFEDASNPIIQQIDERLTLRELKCYYTTDPHHAPPTTGTMQLYMMMVFGRVFACVLTKYPTIQATEEPLIDLIPELCITLINLQRTHLIKTLPRQNCCRCGKPNPLDIELREDPALLPTMVCRGCRLVRYCSAKCQLADWEKHKPVCKQFSAPERS